MMLLGLGGPVSRTSPPGHRQWTGGPGLRVARGRTQVVQASPTTALGVPCLRQSQDQLGVAAEKEHLVVLPFSWAALRRHRAEKG